MSELSKLTDALIESTELRQCLLSGAELVLGSEETTYESQALTKYITAGLNEEHDNDVVRLMAAAAQIASETGLLPPSSPLQTAISAVNCANEMNLAYLVEKGEAMAQDAAEAYIDMATATAEVVVEKVMQPEVLEFGMDRVLDTISAAFPPIAAPAQYLKQFTPAVATFVSETVKPVVQRGIKAVSAAAKSVVKSVIHEGGTLIKKAASKTLSKIKSWF